MKRNECHDRMINAVLRGDLGAVRSFFEATPVDETGDALIAVNINARHSYHGRTALMQAVGMGNFDIAAYILDQGGLPDIKDKNGDTALMMAVRGGHEMIADMLLGSGANPFIVNKRGQSAVELAKASGSAAMSILFADVRPAGDDVMMKFRAAAAMGAPAKPAEVLSAFRVRPAARPRVTNGI